MPLTGFLKFPDIPGESSHEHHVNQVDIHGLEWGVVQKGRGRGTGSGRVRRRASVSRLEVHKFYDKSSPYLALASMQGKSFDEIVLSIQMDSG